MIERLTDFDARWVLGARSNATPGSLTLGQYWMGLNTVLSGGEIACRPGYRCRATLPDGRLQGGTLFTPLAGVPQAVVAIDGVLYAAAFPFRDFRVLEGVLLSPDAERVFWCVAEQTARRTTDEYTSPIELLGGPRRLLLVQDGGRSAPVWYDGGSAGQLRDAQWQTPAGGPMRWVGDRLWQAKGSILRASDIGNPLSFREENYLGGVGFFSFAGEITALAETPDVTDPQLLVFTAEQCYAVQANLREREAWATTTGFQKPVFPVGAVSQRAVTSELGQLTWFSPQGVVTLDAAVAAKRSSRLPIRDYEMQVSKGLLSGDLSGVAGSSFRGFTLFSVPAASRYNEHTWVLQGSGEESSNAETPPAWAGYWTGTRPVEWMKGTVLGEERLYHISKDADGSNRLWEAFQAERLDNGCPITWAVWSRGYFGLGSGAQKLPGTRVESAFADVGLVGVSADLDVGVFVAGSTRGAFRRVAARGVRVPVGSLDPEVEITNDSTLFALKGQSRVIRTTDVRLDARDSGSAGVESDDPEDVDFDFQLLCVFQGPGAVRWVRLYAQPKPDNISGNPEAFLDDDQQVRAVRYDGEAVRDADLAGALEQLAGGHEEFTSVQTFTITADGRDFTAAASATSIISQAAADRAAREAAERRAMRDLAGALPAIVGTKTPTPDA